MTERLVRFYRDNEGAMMMETKIRLTPAQKRALERYNFCLREEDRYFGSVFVNPIGSRQQEAKTKAAFDECVRLGMTHEHGL